MPDTPFELFPRSICIRCRNGCSAEDLERPRLCVFAAHQLRRPHVLRLQSNGGSLTSLTFEIHSAAVNREPVLQIQAPFVLKAVHPGLGGSAPEPAANAAPLLDQLHGCAIDF